MAYLSSEEEKLLRDAGFDDEAITNLWGEQPDRITPLEEAPSGFEAIFPSIVSVGLAFGVGLVLFKLISRNNRLRTVVDHGRKWLSWAVLVACVLTLPELFSTRDVNALAKFALVIVVFSLVGFLLGCAYGKFVKKPRRESPAPQEEVQEVATNPISMTIEQRLIRLGELRDSALISEEEYQSKRSEVLSEI